MNLREDLNALTPRLRRYARALVSGHPGGSEKADDLVHATLMRTLGCRHVGSHADLVIRLYATLTQLHRDIADARAPDRAPAGAKPILVGAAQSHPVALVVRHSKLTLSLMSLPVEDREALLLVALETFDHGDAARILRLSRSELLVRLTRARVAMETHLQTRPQGTTPASEGPHMLGTPSGGSRPQVIKLNRAAAQHGLATQDLAPQGLSSPDRAARALARRDLASHDVVHHDLAHQDLPHQDLPHQDLPHQDLDRQTLDRQTLDRQTLAQQDLLPHPDLPHRETERPVRAMSSVGSHPHLKLVKS